MKKVFLIALLIASINFWGVVFMPSAILNLANAACLLVMLFCTYKVINEEGLGFKKPIILFLIGLLINIFSAYYNNKQSPLDTFIALASFYYVMFYFVLHYLKLDRKFIENIIIAFAILYSLFYIIQTIAYPVPIFDPTMSADRGTIRVRIPGNGFLVLAYFLMLNRFLLEMRPKYILGAAGFFVILLMGGFRTLTFSVLFLSVVMYMRLVRFSFRDVVIISMLVLLFIGLFQFEGTSKIVEEMFNTSKSEMKEGKENVRMVSLNFFLTEFPKNFSYYIIGGGFPGTDSAYTYYLASMTKYYGIYWVDIGLIGFYIIFGIVALVGILWYVLKALFAKLPPNMLYPCYYFSYLLMVSFTTMEIYRSGIFAVETIALYVIDLSIFEMKQEHAPIEGVKV